MPAPAKQKSFIFCVHAHQPVGNFSGVFEEAVDKCYTPFLDVLEAHPRMPVVLHLSGSLIDWVETHRPEFLERLHDLSLTHEIEFLGGAYYEPIYGLIPRRDLSAQIARMSDKIEELFGRRPEGAWLTERVWDPGLVEVLSDAGIRYTVLDDAHFEKSGVAAPVTGYYTANGGPHAVDLFASMKALRYLIPFSDVRDAMRAIRSLKTGPDRAIVFADDCEKFGMWPGTARWVYGERWLDRFFSLLEEDPQVQPTTFSRFRGMHPSVAKVHVPPGSYEEMTEWSNGGFDNFFEKYSESRYMKERMWQVSDRVAEGATEESKTALYQAQCNCSYWHGVFGGLYLHHLRASVFENLIKADAALEGPRVGAPEFQELSFDSGIRWQLRQEKITSFFNLGYGAALEELDFLPKSTNLLCTLQRRPEAYHRFVMPGQKGKSGGPRLSGRQALSIHQILGVKDKGLEKKLCYDSFRKLSFLDHFFESEIGLKDFERNQYEDLADFTDGAFEARLENSSPDTFLHFERAGFVRSSGKKVPVRLQKTVRALGAAGFRVDYCITNEGEETLSATFGVEFNFSIGEESLANGFSQSAVRERIFHDAWRGIVIRLRSEPEALMIAAPIETVSESEGGIEGNYQQTAVLFQRKLALSPGEDAVHTFQLEVS